MIRFSVAGFAAVVLLGLAEAAADADLTTATYDLKSVTVPSGRHAEADGFVLTTEIREDEPGRTISVPNLKNVEVTINRKGATRADVIAFVADQRWPRVDVTTDPRKDGAVVKLRFYGCPQESRSEKVGPFWP